MRLLILTYTFPPANTVAAMRPVRIARAFMSRGWGVSVLHADAGPWRRDLIADTQGIDIQTYRVGFLSRCLQNHRSGELETALRKVARRLIIPEHSWLLRRSAQAAFLAALEKQAPDAIVTISFPFVNHAIGAHAKRKHPTVSWVADNRDMWHGNPYRSSPLNPPSLEQAIERRVFATCDVATFTAPSTLSEYQTRYPTIKNALLVMNGAEPLEVNRLQPPISVAISSKRIRFVHVGSLYSGRRNLTLLLQVLDALKAKELSVQLELAGPDADREQERLQHSAKSLVISHGDLSRAAARKLQSEANVLVICMENTAYDQTFVPAKVFECAMTRRPIIALVRPNSDLAAIIKRYGLGVATFNTDEITEFIKEVLAGRWQPDARALHELTAEFQFNQMVDAVEAVCESTRQKPHQLDLGEVHMSTRF